MDEPPVICTICGKRFSLDSREIWTTPQGDPIELNRSSGKFVVGELSTGEVVVCEECLRLDRCSPFSAADRAELYYQLGLEYVHEGRFRAAIEGLTRSLQCERTSRAVETLASCYSEIGDVDQAVTFYREALELDPGNEVAATNLNTLLERLGGDGEARS